MPEVSLLSAEVLSVEQRRAALQSGPFVGGKAGSARYASAIRVGTPGKCAERPLLAIMAFDNSGSVTGGNDPIGQRFLEAQIAIERIGKRCRCGRDLIATLHFDTPTSGDLAPPSALTKEHAGEIERSLGAPVDGAGMSILLPALRRARQIVSAHPSHSPVFVVLSDFLLFDAYLEELVSFPAEVLAIVLGRASPLELLGYEHIAVTAVNHQSKPGAVARSLFASLVQDRPGANPLPAESLL